MAVNYRVTAKSGLKIRAGAGLNYEEAAEPVAWGEVLIGADNLSTDPAWLPILLEDDSIGYVARQYVQEVQEDGQAIEAVEISIDRINADLPIFQRDLTAKFGYPKERAGYLTTIDLQEFAGHLAHVRDFQGNPWSCRIYGHEMLAGPLKKAFGLICERGRAGELRTYDGCFNIRPMASGGRPSVHSWGLAIDLNARTNPFQRDGSEDLITDFSDELISCFAASGFEWGGLWNSCHDAMHYQLPWTKNWRESDNPLRPQA